MMISVVIPTYNSEKFIEKTLSAMEDYAASRPHRFQIIVVDDSSSDGTYEKLKSIGRNFKSEFLCVQLFNRRGQFRALMAGLAQAQGEYVVTLDDDMEYPPQQIDVLLEKFQKESGCWDVVIGIPKVRRRSLWRNFSSALNNEINTLMFRKSRSLKSGSFRMFTADFVSRLLEFKTINPISGPLIFSATQRISNITVQQQKSLRPSNYSLGGLMETFVKNIQHFSEFPLQMISSIGILIAGCSFLFAFLMLIRHFTGFPRPIKVSGWASLITSIWFLSGMTLATTGLLGQYIYRIIEEVNKTPRYQVRNMDKFPSEQK